MSVSAPPRVARHFLIYGRVQGVGYRDSAVQTAFETGVQGWVRNRMSGHVEAHAQGDTDAVERFAAWLRRGPPLARVTEVAITDAEIDVRLFAFESRATC
ncbi:MAG: acylphosphatase [Betaproteobacteria bacterium]